MSRRQEEESDKASMCEWGIWWHSRRLVSRGIQKCVPRRGEDLARSEDRSEAWGWVKRCVYVRRICPILSLVMVISWLRVGRLEEDQESGVSLIWPRMFECCFLQRSNQERRINSLMKRKRGVRRKEWGSYGKKEQRLFGSWIEIFVTRNTSAVRGPNEGDWNRNCGGSGEERVDPSNKQMGWGWLNDGWKGSQGIRDD